MADGDKDVNKTTLIVLLVAFDFNTATRNTKDFKIPPIFNAWLDDPILIRLSFQQVLFMVLYQW